MLILLISRYLTNPLYVLFVFGLVGFGSYIFVKEARLEPKIASDFFFSKQSRIYQENAKIGRLFVLSESILVSVPAKSIRESAYLDLIKRLTGEIQKIPGVDSVQSLTKGPPSVEAAIRNPLWWRLLDTKTEKSSTIIVFIDPKKVSSVVAKIESLQRTLGSQTYPIYISGVPFIIEKMRLMLARDMKTFLAGAVIVSSAVVLLIFWSLLVTLGCALCSLFAASMTLLLQQYAGVSVGVLTANLGAIVYVLTTSHVIFLTSNWRNDHHRNRNRRIASTVVTTFPASFWAMLTTLLGFLSLVFVEAEPLRQLGLGGTVGTLVAFLSAYLFFPIFLRFSWAKEREEQKESWSLLPLPVWLGLPVAAILLGGSVYYGHQQYKRINTDPSLLTYFKPKSAIYQGIAHVDRLGGSNPLSFVVSSEKPRKLTNSESYQALRNLQNDLESHPAVGSVLSLAALMEETQTNWMARLLPWGSVLNVLSKEQYGKVARGFISDDFNQGLFVIRMKETAGVRDRSQVIRELKTKPVKHGLKLEIVGGTYYLQSELSKKVEASMKSGVTSLFIMFFAIIFLVSFSPLSTLFASVSIAALVAAMVGAIGYLKVPFDIISSPAINICLGIAVDGMIHLIMDVKRHSGGRFNWLTQRAWQIALRRQAGPTFVSAMAVACGFSVFALSEFPPSQRFGLEIVFGSVVAMLLTLLVLPQVGVLMARRHRPNPYKLMPMPELEPMRTPKELEAPMAEVIELKKK